MRRKREVVDDGGRFRGVFFFPGVWYVDGPEAVGGLGGRCWARALLRRRAMLCRQYLPRYLWTWSRFVATYRGSRLRRRLAPCVGVDKPPVAPGNTLPAAPGRRWIRGASLSSGRRAMPTASACAVSESAASGRRRGKMHVEQSNISPISKGICTIWALSPPANQSGVCPLACSACPPRHFLLSTATSAVSEHEATSRSSYTRTWRSFLLGRALSALPQSVVRTSAAGLESMRSRSPSFLRFEVLEPVLFLVVVGSEDRAELLLDIPEGCPLSRIVGSQRRTS